MAAFSARSQGLDGMIQSLRAGKGSSSDQKKVSPAWHDKQSRIAIIGGGVGGVHIGCLLKQAGYHNVQIFESAPQVGGKCLSRFSEGTPFEMGFGLNIISQGPNPLEALVQEYGFDGQRIVVGESEVGGKLRAALKMNRYDSDIGDEEDAAEEEEEEAAGPSAAGASPEKAKEAFTRGKSQRGKHQDDFRRSVSDLSSKIKAASFSNLPPLRRLFTRKLSDIKEQVGAFFGSEPLVSAAKRYARLHRRLLGTYEYGMPPKPKGDSLEQLNLSFAELLKANDLLNLVPVFLLCPISFSYHFLVDLPAFIGLWWYNPTRVTALIDFQRGSLKVPEYTVLESGWQSLWSKMVEVNQVPVLTSTTVKSIKRNKEGGAGKLIAYTNGDDRVKTYDFDLLIVACNLKTALPLIEDATDDEQHIAAALQEFTLCATVYEAAVSPGERPIELFPFPKRNNAFGQVFAQVNSRLLVQKEQLPASGKDRRIVYQFLNRSPRVEDMGMLKRRLKMYFDDQRVEKAVVLKQCPWKFFTHLPAKDIADGWLWRLQDMQGQNKTLYVGAAAISMDSVNEVLLHNAKLVASLGIK